jgi:3-oxoacyl-[acyl-carrier protein] reductase
VGLNVREYSTIARKMRLVTGASRGIGHGIALRLAERGAAVAVNFVQNQAAADDTVARIETQGGHAFAVQADVAPSDEWAAMVRQIRDRFGALDILVNNALGDLLGFMAPPLQVTLDQWNTAFECQQRAFHIGVQTIAPLLPDHRRAASKWRGSRLTILSSVIPGQTALTVIPRDPSATAK